MWKTQTIQNTHMKTHAANQDLNGESGLIEASLTGSTIGLCLLEYISIHENNMA